MLRIDIHRTNPVFGILVLYGKLMNNLCFANTAPVGTAALRSIASHSLHSNRSCLQKYFCAKYSAAAQSMTSRFRRTAAWLYRDRLFEVSCFPQNREFQLPPKFKLFLQPPRTTKPCGYRTDRGAAWDLNSGKLYCTALCCDRQRTRLNFSVRFCSLK